MQPHEKTLAVAEAIIVLGSTSLADQTLADLKTASEELKLNMTRLADANRQAVDVRRERDALERDRTAYESAVAALQSDRVELEHNKANLAMQTKRLAEQVATFEQDKRNHETEVQTLRALKARLLAE